MHGHLKNWSTTCIFRAFKYMHVYSIWTAFLSPFFCLNVVPFAEIWITFKLINSQVVRRRKRSRRALLVKLQSGNSDHQTEIKGLHWSVKFSALHILRYNCYTELSAIADWLGPRDLFSSASWTAGAEDMFLWSDWRIQWLNMLQRSPIACLSSKQLSRGKRFIILHSVFSSLSLSLLEN
jgi:hypothetical protein